jgi:hypothetical protein
MPILELQRRLVEVGRLRMGEKRVAKSGKKYPAKLDHWRPTSRDKRRIEAVASVYGGKVQAWENQWEVHAETDSLDIAVVPGQCVSQHMEYWDQRPDTGDNKPRPVMCLRRCDGETDFISDGPCVCAMEAGEDGSTPYTCKPTTHLSVILRKVSGFGVWRVTSRGNNAAAELAGMAELLEAFTASGRPVPARLRLDQRESVSAEGVTQYYVVPVIDIDVALDEIAANPQLLAIGPSGHQLAAAPPAPLEIEAPADGNGDGPRFTPIDSGAQPSAPARSLADQFGDFDDETDSAEKARRARSNAAAAIPETGVRPGGGDGGGGGSESAPREGGAGTAPDPTPATGVVLVNTEGAQRIARACAEAGLAGDGERAAFLFAFSKGEYRSAHDVPVAALGNLFQTLKDLVAGRVVLDGDANGERAPFLRAPGDDPPDDSERITEVPRDLFWKQQLDTVPGIGKAKLIRTARETAEALGLDITISAYEHIPAGPLTESLLAWLDEERNGNRE